MTFLKLFCMSHPYAMPPSRNTSVSSTSALQLQQQNFNPPDHPPFAPTYSHVSVARINNTCRLVCLAGQVGYDPFTRSIPADLPSQVKVALDNVGKCLDSAGARKEDIVQVRQYVVGMGRMSQGDKDARASVYSEWMEGNLPPSTLLGVESLATAELLYEIEVVAIINAESAAMAW